MADQKSSGFSNSPASRIDPVTGIPYPEPPKIPGILEGLGPQTIRKLAKQTRTLLPEEESRIKNALGGAVNLQQMRLGYDPSIVDTNVGGYEDDRIPGIVFFPPDAEKPKYLEHEATHVHQNLTRNMVTPRYRGGNEVQADQIQDGNSVARKLIASHPVDSLSQAANMSYLYGENQRLSSLPDSDLGARFGSITGLQLLNGLSDINAKTTMGKFSDPDANKPFFNQPRSSGLGKM